MAKAQGKRAEAGRMLVARSATGEALSLRGTGHSYRRPQNIKVTIALYGSFQYQDHAQYQFNLNSEMLQRYELTSLMPRSCFMDAVDAAAGWRKCEQLLVYIEI